MRTVRLPEVEARFDALWPVINTEPFDQLAVGPAIRALEQLVGDQYDPEISRANALANFLR